jgi:biopolymer transport protein ExbB
VWELIKAGGWMMFPIIGCSVIALTIICERAMALRLDRIIPKDLVAQVWILVKNNKIDAAKIKELRQGSPLGRVLAAGLVNLHHSREVMKESIEDVGRHEVHLLERYLNTLGTIAGVSPLMGLLGTVFGMIKIFDAVSAQGMTSPAQMASGIAEALITTAAGLLVAIPALFAYRFYRGKVERVVVKMEQEALKLIEVIHGQRSKQETEDRL